MARMEVGCRRFAMFGGMQIDAGAYAICVHPNAPGLQRRGTLALISEPVGSVALEADACKLAQRAVVEGYFSDHSLGLTSSLLNALDGANSALLQYGAGWGGDDEATGNGEGGGVALQTGVKTRRARVGMTALLLRPDGTGVYLSQMAPTQAYILHNGLLSALPEPDGWTPPPSRTVVSLKRVLAEETEGEAEDDLEVPDLSNAVVPAPSLGSGPGIEADLIYRRVAPGDKIVLVSSELARHIERHWAEEAFAYDADSIVGALTDLAQERGLAEAHACVLELGVPVSSGVDTDYTLPVAPKASAQVAQEGGVSAAPHGPQKAGPGASLLEALRGPLEWFSRRKSEAEPTPAAPELEHPTPIDVEQLLDIDKPLWERSAEDIDAPQPVAELDDAYEIWSRQPTQLLVQRTPDVPPYRSRAANGASASSESGEELQFDGWEDAPPALDDPKYGSTHRVIYKPKVLRDAEIDEPFGNAYGTDGANALEHAYVGADPQVEEVSQAGKPRRQGFDLVMWAQKVVAWGGRAAGTMIPQRLSGPPLAGRRDATRGMVLPLRVVILVALAVVGVVLLLSLLNMRGSAERAATNSLLAEAQLLQTAANQPGLTEAERIQKLQLALDKAQEAAADDPQSEEAQRLVSKLSADLDTAQGVTRLTSLKVLFDLDAIDASAGAAAQPGQEPGATTSEATTASIENDVIAQGNDVYVLDRARSRVYRCQVAAKSCAVVLSAGDTVGGQKVGAPAAITLRVGSPVVLDENLVSYIFSADTGGWAAEPLGGVEGLKKPLGIASYDGNLYLLGAKAGQVSKYLSGQYGQPPIDWITDGPTVEAMREPAAMAIDGVIYVALADGKVLAMQGGKLTGTFTPKSTSDMGVPTRLFTNTDIRDLYILRSGDGSVTRLNKEGQTLSILKAPIDSGLTGFSGLAVDEGRSKIYVTIRRKVYEAALPGAGAKTTPAIQSEPQSPAQQAPQATNDPSVKPTVVP